MYNFPCSPHIHTPTNSMASSSSMEAADQEPQIEIPTHFLCPISLELMVDPVTVSTGITYDRPSIHRWLVSSSAAVCPVTKQPLSSAADLTPNHVLRRLIHSWSTVNALDPIPDPPVNALDRVSSLASRLIDSETDAVETLATLAGIPASEAELKSVMTSTGGPLLVNRLTRFLTDSYYHDPESQRNSIKLLRSLYSVAGPNQLTAVDPELFAQTVRLLGRNGPTATTKWALKLLSRLAPWGRNRVKAVNAGAVEALIEILLDAPEQKRVCELAMAVLDQLCGCAEGRAGLLGHRAGLAVVSKRILRVSNGVSDRAVRVIGSVSRYSGNGVVLGEMLEVGVVAKLCLVVQVECSLKTKERAKEILSRHSSVWKHSPCVPTNLLRSFPS